MSGDLRCYINISDIGQNVKICFLKKGFSLQGC